MFRLAMVGAVGVLVVGVGEVSGSSVDISMTVNPPLSDPPFSVSSGYSMEVAPVAAINLTVPNEPGPNTNRGDDDKWGVDPDYGGTGIFVMGSRHSFENSPEIALTIGGLTDSPYDVFAQTFVNSASGVYGGRYGFSSGALTPYFSSDGGDILEIGDMSHKPEQGQFQIREFFLGTQGSTDGAITVYMDDFDGASLVGNIAGLRLAVVPEPGSTALLLCGAFTLLGFAWRKKRHTA